MTVPAGALPGGYTPASPGDDYPAMKPGMSQRDYDKAIRRWYVYLYQSVLQSLSNMIYQGKGQGKGTPCRREARS